MENFLHIYLFIQGEGEIYLLMKQGMELASKSQSCPWHQPEMNQIGALYSSLDSSVYLHKVLEAQ